jgi:nicotinamidase-related amidase
VLSTLLGAIDWVFRVILVTDALCSSSDKTHDAMMNVYMNRFGEQVETVTTSALLVNWTGGTASFGNETWPPQESRPPI